ncbi:MAG: CHAT domain-containing protein [Thermoanaerobaculia bacterium]
MPRAEPRKASIPRRSGPWTVSSSFLSHRANEIGDSPMKPFVLAVLLCIAPAVMASNADLDRDRLGQTAMLAFSGKHEEARPQLESALAAYRVEKNDQGAGVALVLLGIVDVAANQSMQARLHLEEGAAVLRRADDFITSFLALWMLAELDTSTGKLQSSLIRHATALAALEAAAAPGATFKLDGLKLLGPAVGMDMGMLENAGPIGDVMKPIFLAMFESMVRDSYAKVLVATGNFDEAEQQLTRARATDSMFHMFDQSIEAHTGDLRRRQWRFDEAREHYKKALDDIRPMPVIPGRDEWTTIHALGQLADIEALSGRINESLAWNDRALDVVRKSKNRKREAAVLISRGELFMGFSRYGDAEAAFAEGLAIAEAAGDRFQQAVATSWLGNLYFLRGDYGRAATTLEKSLPLLEHADAAVMVSVTLITLTETYLALGAEDTARDTLKRARALAREHEFALAEKFVDILEAMMDSRAGKKKSDGRINQLISEWWELPDTGDLMLPAQFREMLRNVAGLETAPAESASPAENARAGQLPALAAMKGLLEGIRLYRQGDLTGARAAWQKVLKENAHKELTAPLLAGIGATYWRESKIDDAVPYFERAVAAVGQSMDDVKVEELLAGYLGSERRWYFEIAIQSLTRQGRIADAFDQAERARARAFLHSIANARLQPERGGEPTLVSQAEALRKRIASWRRDAALDSGQGTAEDLRHARAEYQSLLKRVKASNPEYASLTTVEPLHVEDVQQVLPPDTTLLSYFVGQNIVHAWVVEPQAIKYVSLPVSADHLQSIVCWTAHLQSSGAVRAPQPQDPLCPTVMTSEDVYGMLIAPLRAHIHNARLIVVPHGVLHYVPFAALRDAKTNRYLLEDYTISYVPTASSLRFLRDKETPMDGSSLVMGNPAADGTALAGAQREAIAVAKVLGTTARLGKDATESVLYDLGGKYDVVHIAAHAQYDGAAPLFSHVALARDSRADGRLEVNDILSTLDFKGVNLVVLSACGTARGARSGGDEIVGLTRALLYAGTPRVISTLWDVDDDATADLMIEMYESLRKGAPMADALRAAQLSILKRKPYADPQFWAAFQLNGDAQGRWPADAATH